MEPVGVAQLGDQLAQLLGGGDHPAQHGALAQGGAPRGDADERDSGYSRESTSATTSSAVVRPVRAGPAIIAWSPS